MIRYLPLFIEIYKTLSASVRFVMYGWLTVKYLH